MQGRPAGLRTRPQVRGRRSRQSVAGSSPAGGRGRRPSTTGVGGRTLGTAEEHERRGDRGDEAAPEHRPRVAAEVGRATEDRAGTPLRRRSRSSGVEREHGRALLRRDHVVEVGAVHRVVDRRGDAPHREEHEGDPEVARERRSADEHDARSTTVASRIASRVRLRNSRRTYGARHAADDAGPRRGWPPRAPRSSRRPLRRPRAPSR